MNLTILSRMLAGRAEAFCQQYLPAGKREGREWLVGDVEGQPGRSLAVVLDGPKAGLWNDRADQTCHGDLLDLLALRLGTKIKAADEARAFLNLPAWQPGERNGTPQPSFDPLRKGFRHAGETAWRYPVAAWAYHDSTGHVIAYSCRFDLPPDATSAKPRKEFRPLRFIDGQWRWKGFASPELKPMYGQHRLASRPDAPVLFVEGEKSADAAQKLFPDYVAVSAMNGAKTIASGRVDLTPLLSRTTPLILWPDNDDAGHQAMQYLRARFPDSHMVRLPAGLPDGWDLADPCPEGLSLRGLLDGARNPPPPPAGPDHIPCPYRPLGMAGGKHHYQIVATGDISGLRPEHHTELSLHDIAPDSYWEQLGDFFQQKSTHLDYKLIAKHMMTQSRAAGFFDDDRIRGRGVWIDQGRVVIHSGLHLHVDGVLTPLGAIQSRFIYERGRQMDVDLSNPLPASESAKLHEISLLLPWSDPNSAWMFSGFMFASLIDGALAYRPSQHLYGEPDSGKSWTIENIVKPVWGPFCLQMAGGSSEASYRHLAKHDAISFLVDEFETESEQQTNTARKVLTLLRQSTTDTNAKIYRGTPEGNALSYTIRSNFMFASISVLPTGRADESRLTALELIRRADQEPFRQLKAIWQDTVMHPAWCGRLRARAFTRVREILAAIDTFARAIRRASSDARMSLQLGTMAAGCWMLCYDTPPTDHEADAWIASVGLCGYRPDPEQSDHHQCLNHLLSSRIRRDNNTTSTVADLLQRALSLTEIDIDARRTLLQHGIRLDPQTDMVTIANQHRLLSEIYQHTRWAEKWRDQFARLGTKQEVTRFGLYRSRAVSIPLSVITGKP